MFPFSFGISVRSIDRMQGHPCLISFTEQDANEMRHKIANDVRNVIVIGFLDGHFLFSSGLPIYYADAERALV